jgi:hypothetical protein
MCQSLLHQDDPRVKVVKFNLKFLMEILLHLHPLVDHSGLLFGDLEVVV